MSDAGQKEIVSSSKQHVVRIGVLARLHSQQFTEKPCGHRIVRNLEWMCVHTLIYKYLSVVNINIYYILFCTNCLIRRYVEFPGLSTLYAVYHREASKTKYRVLSRNYFCHLWHKQMRAGVTDPSTGKHLNTLIMSNRFLSN